MTALTDSERVDARRFCGYPAFGTSSAGLLSLKFSQRYAYLESRLSSLSASETAIVRKYLVTLATLENAVPGVSDNLDTDQASMWSRNRDEFSDRIRLLDEWRHRLCGFLGVPKGPSLGCGSPELIV